MHKVHVTVIYNESLTAVFDAISDHRSFLSGGGFSCNIIKPGLTSKNGLGAIRSVRTKKYTLIEEITAFVENKSYDYIIKEIRPDVSLVHHNGWLEFTEVGHNKIKVDWHSHFTITTPVIGHFIGWLVKRQVQKIFSKRLNHVKNTTLS